MSPQRGCEAPHLWGFSSSSRSGALGFHHNYESGHWEIESMALAWRGIVGMLEGVWTSLGFLDTPSHSNAGFCHYRSVSTAERLVPLSSSSSSLSLSSSPSVLVFTPFKACFPLGERSWVTAVELVDARTRSLAWNGERVCVGMECWMKCYHAGWMDGIWIGVIDALGRRLGLFALVRPPLVRGAARTRVVIFLLARASIERGRALSWSKSFCLSLSGGSTMIQVERLGETRRGKERSWLWPWRGPGMVRMRRDGADRHHEECRSKECLPESLGGTRRTSTKSTLVRPRVRKEVEPTFAILLVLADSTRMTSVVFVVLPSSTNETRRSSLRWLPENTHGRVSPGFGFREGRGLVLSGGVARGCTREDSDAFSDTLAGGWRHIGQAARKMKEVGPAERTKAVATLTSLAVLARQRRSRSSPFVLDFHLHPLLHTGLSVFTHLIPRSQMPSNCDPEIEQTTTCVDLPKALESDHLPASGAMPPNPEAFHAPDHSPPTNPEANNVENPEMRTELSGILSKSSSLSSHVVSAVHKLPTELLSEIFDLCFPEELYYLNPTNNTPQDEFRRISQDHILQLAHVCSRWYNVAMDTPKLWTTITIHMGLWRYLTPPVESILDMLKAVLDRGRDYPLTLTICTSAFDDAGERALELFAKHGHKWRELALYAFNPPPIALLHSTTKLERLERLHFEPLRRALRSWKDVEIFQHAPRLTKLEFRGFPNRLPKLPWNQIKSCIHYMDETVPCIYHPLTVLRNAAPGSSYELVLDLQNCSASDHEGPWGLDASSKVRDLQIWFSDRDRATTGNLFDTLNLPRVQSLALRGIRGMHFPIWACDAFLRLANRSSFYDHIFELAVCRVMVSDADLLRCLEVLPRLQTLSITECDMPSGRTRARIPELLITDRLLRALVYSADVPALVPKLYQLRLEPVIDKYSDSAFADLVVSRVHKIYDIDNNGPFKTILGRERCSLSSSLLETFDELVSAGKLVFHCV
ncbi:hypothetical protein R3P38DRAFT_3576687 [Favolaschia claudopus]|uniref:F-box domain-containing protein n=1 Tax=Favolaschia claudopus TaxID=2862362 RepID=A0AAW0DSJ2_9AGAR